MAISCSFPLIANALNEFLTSFVRDFGLHKHVTMVLAEMKRSSEVERRREINKPVVTTDLVLYFID
jgi:hypothetical protein